MAHPQTEVAVLRTSNCSLLLIYLPRKDKRLSRPGWLTYSGRFTHISGHPSAAGRAQDSESSPVRDRRSTTVPCTVCSCCVTSPYREVYRAKGGIGSGETSSHDIYPARFITTVSLTTNTYCGWRFGLVVTRRLRST